MALETLFESFRQFDDHLEFLAPRGYVVPCSNVTARAALQSLQWSMYPVSILRRTATSFLYLRNAITYLARTVLNHDQDRLHQFESLITKLADRLDGLDRGMQQVFPSDAPYMTSLFVQSHYSFRPALDDKVMRSLPLRRVFR